MLVLDTEHKERRLIHVGAQPDRVVLGKPTHAQRVPGIVCAEVDGALAWWTWETASLID